MIDGWTISEASEELRMPRRELVRRLKTTPPVGSTYGRRGRRASVWLIADILRAEAAWRLAAGQRR